MIAEPFRPPVATVKSLVGGFDFTGDSLWWQDVRVTLPEFEPPRRRPVHDREQRHDTPPARGPCRDGRHPVGVSATAREGIGQDGLCDGLGRRYEHLYRARTRTSGSPMRTSAGDIRDDRRRDVHRTRYEPAVYRRGYAADRAAVPGGEAATLRNSLRPREVRRQSGGSRGRRRLHIQRSARGHESRRRRRSYGIRRRRVPRRQSAAHDAPGSGRARARSSLRTCRFAERSPAPRL